MSDEQDSLFKQVFGTDYNQVALQFSSYDADIQRARANALEVQLAKLHDLPAALEAAWRRSGPTVVSPKAPSKRSKRRSP